MSRNKRQKDTFSLPNVHMCSVNVVKFSYRQSPADKRISISRFETETKTTLKILFNLNLQ